MASPTVDQGTAGPTPPVGGHAPRGEQGARPGRLRRWAHGLRHGGAVRLLSAAVGGIALSAAFAPSTRWWLAIVGIALLGLALYGRPWRAALGLGFVFGLAFYLPLLTWTGVYVGDPPWVALSVIEAALVAAAAVLIAWSTRLLPAWPVWAAAAWTAGEALRAHFPFGGFPWGAIAYSQPDGPLLPAASLLGAPAMGFLTALAGFALAALARVAYLRLRGHAPVRKAAFIAPVLLLIAPFVLGAIGLTTELTGSSARHVPIAVIQGNVPQPGLEFNARRMAVLTMHANETHRLAAAVRAGKAPQPVMVLWPENSSDIDPYTNPDAAALIDAAAKDVGVPILVGAVVQAPKAGGEYNMGIVWNPVTGPGQTYTKRHPVPFAEYLPYRSFLEPILQHFNSDVGMIGNFLPGDKPGNLTISGIPVGDVICFEIAYDGLVRDAVDGGAQVLVVQTNNATFGYTDETYQQEAMSRVHAVEHGREVLITATSGVSAVIRPTGQVESSIPLFTAGYMVPSVPLIAARTPGTVVGGPLTWALIFASPVALLCAFAWRRRRVRVTTCPGEPGEDAEEECKP